MWHPNNRHAKAVYKGSGYRNGHRHAATDRPPSFGFQLITASVGTAVIVFLATPSINIFWRNAVSTPDQITARERGAYYARCDDARAAGVAPIYRGQPGYREGLDRDSDGIACEPYR